MLEELSLIEKKLGIVPDPGRGRIKKRIRARDCILKLLPTKGAKMPFTELCDRVLDMGFESDAATPRGVRNSIWQSVKELRDKDGLLALKKEGKIKYWVRVKEGE